MNYRFEKNAGDSVSVFGGRYGNDYIGSFTTAEARSRYGYNGEVVQTQAQQQQELNPALGYTAPQNSPQASSQRQNQRQPIPDYIYDNLRNAIVNGQTTPRQALDSLQKLTQTGNFLTNIDENRILQPITVSTSRGTFTISPATALDWRFDSSSVENQLTRGNISGVHITRTEQSPTLPEPPQKKAIQEAVKAAVESGQLNPDLTEEDISRITWQQFFPEMMQMISPQFKEKARYTADSFLSSVGKTQADLDYALSTQQRTYTQNLEKQEEDFSNRGLAFSGQRREKAQELGSAFEQSQRRTRDLAFREAQDALSKTEQTLGTEGLRSLSIPQIGGRNLSLSSTPFKGSDVYEQESSAQTLARQRADERRMSAYYNLQKYG